MSGHERSSGKQSFSMEPAAPAGADPFATRYELHELLGEGGMARVHRATDLVLRREVALKLLAVDVLTPSRAHMLALFEREFHTLAQLSHPHVIEVFDYGLSADGSPFYTMELLDGGDLRERAPLPWREVCRLMFDVCSALALLHSRRLLHRDITPRNIRCTRAAVAKLIDFGAMSPMSAGGSDIVGTPAFTAPETLQRLALDARTDLYSLGVTLYYALTGRLPYGARSFADLLTLWADKPLAPSSIVPEIPAALDDLVLSLVSVEPALRPSSAFEVMQQLAACAGIQAEESEAVSRAYLSTPTLVGRDAALATLQDALRDSRLHRSSGVLVQAPPGGGRSRLLDACALDALTRGFRVARATATGSRASFAVAQRLVQHMLDTLPQAAQIAAVPELFSSAPQGEADAAGAQLRDLAQLQAEQVQKLLRVFLRRVSRAYPLLIAVDDVHKIDEPSAALLAELVDSTRRGGILILLTADSDTSDNAALHALARRCALLPLAALTREQTRRLLDSLFGEVPNLQLLSDELHDLALGNPRQTLELAQHLVDQGLIRYAAGSWVLPQKLGADDLPRSASAALHARLARFSERARFIGEAQALAFFDDFTDDEYRALLPAASSRDVELALAELLEAGALLQDGAVYRLASRVWSAAFLVALDEEQTRLRHRALADMYAAEYQTATAHHAFSAGELERGLTALRQRNEAPLTESEARRLADHDAGRFNAWYPLAIDTARRLGRPPRELHALRRWQYLGSVASRAPADRESARIWLEQLSHDAGLDFHRSDTESATSDERVARSLARAHERYLATPEHARVYPVDAAVRLLGEYVLISVVVGARTLDSELLHELPDILEPYIRRSPLLEAIWLNMLGAREGHCNCNYERARELWRETIAKVDALPAGQDPIVGRMRSAVLYALGSAETQLGLVSAAELAEQLESVAAQRISALQLRKIVRLEQGDVEGAERLRRQAEVLSLQQRLPQMFNASLYFDAFVYAMCNNLAGLTLTIEQIKPLSARYSGWVPVLLHAEGCFQLVRGDYEAARSKFAEVIERERNRGSGARVYFWTWMNCHAGLANCLMRLGRAEEAREIASAALRECEARGTGVSSFYLIRVLALIESKLGDPRGAQRLDELIARQVALGASGLRLGLSYEGRASIAIWSRDESAFEHYSELTAREYRHGARTPLAARYQRLMNEAARAGMQPTLSLADFQALSGSVGTSLHSDQLLTLVTRSMAGHRSGPERAEVAIQMICSAHAARTGHLFLLTPAGPVLSASQGAATPPRALAAFVSDYASLRQQQAEELDDMETGALTGDSSLESALQIDDRRYELLPLSCAVDSSSVLVGLAVIERAEAQAASEHTDLLSALAASLRLPAESRAR